MADWVIYAEDIRKAMSDLEAVSPNRVTDEGEYIAKLGPVGLIMDGVRAMALMGSDSPEGDVELNAVVAKGNIKILGAFDEGVFIPAYDGAEIIFRSMRLGYATGVIGGKEITVELPDQFTAFI